MTDSSLTAAALPEPTAPYLAGLNERQRAAVLAMDGPVLVLAGAGTGKTRVLTTRLAHILSSGLAWPSQILAVTFTNKAANEMKERIAHLLGRPVEGWWLGTFHSLAARILRSQAELVGLKTNFTIIGTDDQLRLVKQLIEAEGLDSQRWPSRVVLGIIERWKDRGLTPDKVSRAEMAEVASGRILDLYHAYQQRLLTLNACDFGDLLLHNLTIFQKSPEQLARYQNQFRYILVDEYQDTNVAQYLWLRALAQAHKNICCVGDDDQCLAAGTAITLADGRTRRIEKIKKGDQVLSAYGSGDFRPASVLRVARRSRRNLVRIRTAGGRVLTSTPEHMHFAGYRLGRTPQTYFVYLMWREGVGCRLGTTQVYTRGQVKPMVGFAQRSVHEHADAVWILSTHATENAARAEEYEFSLRYRIPTLPFTPWKGRSVNGLVHDPAYIARIFAAFDTITAGQELLQARGQFWEHPHYRPRSRNSKRRNVVISLCGDRRGATPMHRLSIVGNDEPGARRLRALGLSVRRAKADSASWRVETCNKSLAEIMRLADRIAEAFPTNRISTARFGRQDGAIKESNSLPMLPAGAVQPGMVMFDGDGGYDLVQSVERLERATDVYDLDVEHTHNFIANGLVTHNSVYGWRGAEVENILKFEKDFPGAAVIRLEQNYRSTPHILAAASGLIAHNEGRLGKTLWTEVNEGEKVRILGAWDGTEEARQIGDEVETLQRRGTQLKDIAILVRAGFQMREFEERFITLGVPYRVIGGPRFYERQEIRDALAYLRLIHQPDDGLAFERIVNLPRRGIGDTTLKQLNELARAQSLSVPEVARQVVGTDELKPAARRALGMFMNDVARWRQMAGTLHHAELAQTVLDESGYKAMWRADKSIEAPGRVENLDEFVRALEDFDSLEGFLEHVSLVMENAQASPLDQLSIMTLHGAKGLEFDVVFLPGWEEELFPHPRSLNENGNKGLEEERRLAYVGLTRARKCAIISHVASRFIHGRSLSALPSRFLAELPGAHIDRQDHQGFKPLPAGGYNEWPTRAYGGGGGFAPRRAPTIDVEAQIIPKSGGVFPSGKRVFHQKFGYGKVLTAEGDKLEIAFDKAGVKKVMAGFVVPAEQAG